MPSPSLVALVAIAASYAELQQRADPVENLGRFLETYLGDCGGDDVEPAARTACLAAARADRRRYQGKLLRVRIEDPSSAMSLAGYDRGKKAFRVDLVPFFSERGLGLSVGRPKRLNASGLPVMRRRPIWVTLPEDTPDFVFRRNLERGMFRLELLVRPDKPYRLTRRGQTPVRGVAVELVGLRLVDARSGAVLAEQIP